MKSKTEESEGGEVGSSDRASGERGDGAGVVLHRAGLTVGPTPGPWRAAPFGYSQWAITTHGKFRFVAITAHGNDEANARHIVQCVNSHGALIEAIKAARTAFASIANGITAADRCAHTYALAMDDALRVAALYQGGA